MGAGARPFRIDDLDSPRLPFFMRAANALGAPFAKSIFLLDEEGLHEIARKATGLSDFGDPGYLEPFRVLLGALEGEADLHAFGRFMTRRLLISLLISRLRLEELIRQHPEILAEEIDRPIVIGGLPRTGTTHLMNLLSRDPRIRSLPFWESLEPFPDPDEGPAPDGRDPRIERCERALAFQTSAMPLLPAMHEFEPELPHEEIQLMAMQFSTQLFEASYCIPSYRDWMIGRSQTPAYRHLERCLKALQWIRGPRRWVLKTPQHLENLLPLFEVFPDARFVQTHRDPVRVAVSLCTMIAYGRRMNTRRSRLDAHALARDWVERQIGWLDRSIVDRPKLPAGQLMDVHFHAFMSDQIGTVERVFEFAGHPLDHSARSQIEAFIATNAAGRFGTIDYRFEPLGLDRIEMRTRMAFYQRHFGVPDA